MHSAHHSVYSATLREKKKSELIIDMKKTFILLLLAALTCGMSMCVTSCKDDDKDNGPSEEQQDQQALEQQELDNARYAVLDQLADLDEVTDSTADYLSQNFPPAIGMPADSTDESIRIVSTNTMEMAAERFANIIGATGIDENTTSYTWTDDKMGSMTYTKVDDGTAWATVDVDIHQVRGLHKIIFRSPEMGDENASLKGRAFYRFGDIIWKLNYAGHGQLEGVEYWVCVRPAFGPEGKDDSHWATFYRLSQNNFLWHRVGDASWKIPTKLGEDKEHMQNLAEMLYAMLFPEQWEVNLANNSNNKKMKMFGDFKIANEGYHNKYFWQNVCKAWETLEDEDRGDGQQFHTKKDLWHILFNASKDEMKQELSENGLHLLYKGYSWVSKKNLDIQFWQAKYTNGTGVKSNMHNVEYTKPSGNLDGVPFDCTLMGGAKQNYSKFFNNDGKMRWCVRFATGKELTDKARGKYSWKTKIPGSNTVYRYYLDVDREGGKDLNKAPEPDVPLF